MSTHKYNMKTADGSEKSSMPNLMSSHRDEDKNVKNVEHFSPSLSEVRETADILIDSTAGVCL